MPPGDRHSLMLPSGVHTRGVWSSSTRATIPCPCVGNPAISGEGVREYCVDLVGLD